MSCLYRPGFGRTGRLKRNPLMRSMCKPISLRPRLAHCRGAALPASRVQRSAGQSAFWVWDDCGVRAAGACDRVVDHIRADTDTTKRHLGGSRGSSSTTRSPSTGRSASLPTGGISRTCRVSWTIVDMHDRSVSLALGGPRTAGHPHRVSPEVINDIRPTLLSAKSTGHSDVVSAGSGAVKPRRPGPKCA
jgi:hypothetical protein